MRLQLIGFRILQLLGWTMAFGGFLAGAILTLYVGLLVFTQLLHRIGTGVWPQATALHEWIGNRLGLPIPGAEWAFPSHSLQFLLDLPAEIGIYAIAVLCLVIARCGVYLADNATYRLVQVQRIRRFIFADS